MRNKMSRIMTAAELNNYPLTTRRSCVFASSLLHLNLWVIPEVNHGAA
jgi:hypothetical protein